MDRPIITKAEAKAAGLARFFTGKPCKHGHLSERRTNDHICVECAQLAGKSKERKATIAAWSANNRKRRNATNTAWRAENREKVRAQVAASAARYPERVKARKAAWQAKNREKLTEAQAARRAADPEKVRAWWRAWTAKNPEKKKASKAAWRARNREKAKAEWYTWAKDNPEKVIACRQNTRAKRKAAEGHHTAEDIQRIYEAQNGKCACCKTKVGKEYHLDHIQALSKGGSNWPSNLQITCKPCNRKKGARDPIEFMQSMGMLL